MTKAKTYNSKTKTCIHCFFILIIPNKNSEDLYLEGIETVASQFNANINSKI